MGVKKFRIIYFSTCGKKSPRDLLIKALNQNHAIMVTLKKLDSRDIDKIPGAIPPKMIAWLDDSKPSFFGILCGIMIFLIPLLLYLVTAMREPSDHGDYAKWAFIGKIWGIPHPTGFPLYIFLNAMMSRLPLGTLIFRVTLISSISVAAAMHMVYRIGRLNGFQPLLALAVAFLTSTGSLVWRQALTTDVYGLHLLIVTASVWTLLRWDQSDDDRWMWAAIWLFLLGMANHPTTIFTLPGLLIFTLVRKPRIYLNRWTWIHATGALLVVAGLYSYFLIRSTQQHLFNEGLWDGPLNGDLHRFWLYITGRDFAQQWGMLGDNVATRLWTLFHNGELVLGRFGWVLVLVGIPVAAIRNWRRFLLLLLVPGGILAANFMYNTFDFESWFAPSYPFIALFAGFSILLIPMIFSRSFNSSDESREDSTVGKFILTSASLLLLIVAFSHILSGLPAIDRSNPSDEYQSARRMVNVIEAPALIVPHKYDTAMNIMYCFYEDDSRRDEWPQYFGLKEVVDLSRGTLSPIIMKWVWDDDLVRQAIEKGMHVYVMGPGVELAQEQYWLRIVDTGSDEPEMSEIVTEPEQGDIAPE